ncbi:MAG TPA: CDP-diacylglycerol--glycerol-3-phosphate 3-phosphatidyltransferase [Candidatus Wallbacteria bacterium]|nr:CDP-diacylglycerol--glycerol-3-phosphate 3-phosphatidyltransferase [Candidatus Wallbacteria bacterium]
MPVSFIMRLNVANKISVFRIAVIPVFMALFIFKPDPSSVNYYRIGAWFLFILAAISDLVDGYYARNFEKVTNFGKLIDPIADKMLVTAALLCLVEDGKVASWVAFLIIGRDTAISGLRIIAAARGHIIDASPMGKWKTVLQPTAIITCLTFYSFDELLKIAGIAKTLSGSALLNLYKYYGNHIVDALMYASAFIALVSGYDYFKKNKSVIKD